MGSDTIREALGRLQVDADDTESWEQLGEVVGSNGASDDAARKLFAAARKAHVERGEWHAVARLLPIEVAAQSDTSKKVMLLMEHARVLQHELLNEDQAVRIYQEVLGLVPDDELTEAAIAESDERRAKWRDMAEQYSSEAETAADDVYKASMLMRAAEVELRFAGKDTDMERVLGLLAQAMEADPKNLGVLQMLENIYRQQQDFEALPSVLQRWIKNSPELGPRVAAGVRLARLHRNKLSDAEAAAAAYEQVLELNPSHPEAVEWLVEYYSSRENWDKLVQLYERELQQYDLSRAERVGDMLQIAMLHYKKRQNMADAAAWFERVRAVDPTNGAMLAFFRDYCSANGDEALLLQVLQGAQRVLASGPEKTAITQEIAQLAESQEDAQKAIEQYKALLRQDADNDEARKALKSLYRKTQGYNQLVDLLRHELERLSEDDKEARLAILREVAGIYREHIPNETSLVSALNQILQVDDSDKEAVRELIGLYEKLERWRDLLTNQQRLATLSDDPEERVALLRASGRRWLQQFNNVQNATAAFEALLEIQPTDREARDTLAELYKKRRAWPALYKLYETEVESLTGAQKVAIMKEMAKLAAERLSDPASAMVLYKQILEAEPANLAILDALEKQSERSKDWPTLAEALERRASAGLDPRAQIAVLQKLGSVYEDHLKDLQKSASAWRRVLELQPGSNRAIRTLRDIYLGLESYDQLDELYTSQNDFEGLADVLSNAADKATDLRTKIDLSYRAASVYEDRLHQPARAFRSYERILSADPMDTRAARALVPLYEDDEKWARLPALYELLLADTSDLEDKLALYRRLIQITGQRLVDRTAAVEYAKQAYQLDPEREDGLALFEEACREAGSWEPFVEALEAQLKTHRESKPPQSSKGRRRGRSRKGQQGKSDQSPESRGLGAETVRRFETKLASVYHAQLGRTDDAIAAYKRLLEAQPEAIDAAREMEALLTREGRRDDLRWLLGLRVEHAGSEEEAVLLMQQWAELEEASFGDVPRAAELYRRILERRADHETALRELPRLLLVQGEAEDAVTVMTAHRDRLEGAERANLEVALAEVYLERLEKPAEALESAVRAVEQDASLSRAVEVLQRLSNIRATQRKAAEVLAGVYRQSGENRREADALMALLSAEKDPSQRLSLYERTVGVYEQLGSYGSAFDVILKACHEFPSELSLWDQANALCGQAGRPTELADAYREVLQAELSPEMQQQLCERAATLFEEQLGDPVGAAPYLEKVLALDPGNQAAFLKLKQILTSAQRWGELQALYERTANAVDDPEVEVEILGEVAMICEEFMEDEVSAMNYYQRMLSVMPDQEGALEALDRLYEKHGKMEALEGILQKRLVTATTSEDATSYRLRLARLELEQLHLPDRALKNVEDVLLEDVGNSAARELAERILEIGSLRGMAAMILERVYETRDDIRDLARVLEIRIEVLREEDPGSTERRTLLRRLATLRNDRLRDDPGASKVLAEYIPLEPQDVEARSELLEIAERTNGWQQAAEILERAALAAEAQAHLSGEILLAAARIRREELNQRDEAEATYRKVVELDASDPDLVLPAARALEQIYLSADRHEPLVEVLRLQLDLEADAEVQSGLLGRIARLCEEQLHDLPAAIAAWKTRMDLHPDDAEALLALDRLHERSENWAELVRILEMRRDHSTDPAERRELYRRSYLLLSSRLDKLPEAIDAARALIDEFGADPGTLTELEGFLQRAERWDELADTLGMHLDLAETTDQRLSLLTAIGDVRRAQLSNPGGALEAYREVVATNPNHAEARAALEELLEDEDRLNRREAAEILQAVYEGESNNERLLVVLLILVETHEDPVTRLDFLRRAIQVVDTALGDAAKAFELAVRAVREAAGHVDLEPWLDELERLAEVTGKRAEQVEVLRGIVDEIFDGEVQFRVLMKVARLAREHIRDNELALDYYRRASEARVDSDEALLALEELYTETESYEPLLEVLERRTDLSQDDAARRELLIRRGELLDRRLKAPERAARVYERVLELGLDDRTIEALVDLYTREKRWDDLVLLHQRRLDAGHGDAAALHVQIAKVAAHQQNDVYRAFDELEAALATTPHYADAIAELERLMTEPGEAEQHARAAALLEPIYLARSDYDQVMKTLNARLEYADVPEERRELLQRLAQLHEEQKEDYAAALETVAQLFHEDSTDSHTAAELERLAKVADGKARLAEVYSVELEKATTDDPNTARMARRAGELYRDLEQHEKALGYYRRALEYEPDSRELFEAVDGILEHLEKHQERVDLYRAALEHRFDEKDRLKLLHTMASLQVEKLNQKEEAIATYVEALELKEDDAKALDTLSWLYYETKRFEDLYDLVLKRAEAAPNQSHAAKYRLALARLCRDQIGDSTRAMDQLEEIVMVEPAHKEAIEELEAFRKVPEQRARAVEILLPLYEQSDQWKRIIKLNEDRFQLAEAVGDQVAVLRETAKLWEERGGDPRRALHVMAAALKLDPEDPDVRMEYERLVEATQSWDTLAEQYRQILDAMPDLASARDLWAKLAKTHDGPRDDPRAALEAYARLRELDDSELEPVERMESLSTLLSDWETLDEVLVAKADLVLDDEERASIWRRVGEGRRDMLGRPQAAIEAYERALEFEPDSAFTVDCLIELYEEQKSPTNLVELYQRRVELTEPDDTDLRYDLYLSAAACHEKEFKDRIRAIEMLTHALEAKPGDVPVLERLNELYRAEEQWPELLENLRTQSNVAQDMESRAGFYRDMGELLSTKLESFEEALEAYEVVLQDFPADAKARAAVRNIGQEHEELRERVAAILLPALSTAKLFEEYVEILELRLTVESDPIARAQTLRAMAKTLESELGATGRAHAALLRAMAEVPEDESLHAELERLSEAADDSTRWGAYADALTERAQTTFDADLAKELYARLGQIAEEKLTDTDRALDAYNKAVDQVGDQPEILLALDRLYTQGQRWPELVDVLERRVPLVDSDAERAELYYRSAAVQIDQFSEAGQGLAALRNALELDANHTEACKKLEELTERRDLFEEAAEVLESVYRARGTLDQLASLSEKRVEFAETPGERIEMRKSLARVLEDEVGNVQAAQRVVQAGLDDDPSDEDLLSEIERLAGLTGDWAQATGALSNAIEKAEDLSPMVGKDLCLRLASWCTDYARDRDAAEKALERAYGYDEMADDVLVRLQELQSEPGRELRKVATLRRRARLQLAEDEREALYREAYELATEQNDQQLAEQIVRELLEHDDANRWALTELCELRSTAGDHEETYTLLRSRIDLALDAEEISSLRHRIAELARTELDDKARAAEHYEQIFTDDPLDTRASSALRELYGELGRAEELSRLLERLIEIADEPSNRNALRVELAKMRHEKFRDSEAAEELLSFVLEDEPGHTEAVVMLSHLYEAGGKDQELAELLTTQIDAARERGDRESELRFRVRLGEIYDTKLADRQRAIETYNQVLEQEPNHREALAALARLYRAAGELEDAANILATMVENSCGDEQMSLLKELSATYLELNDRDRAVQCLEIALQENEREADVRDQLRSIYREDHQWEKLGELLAVDARLATEEAAVLSNLREAARIFSDQAKNHARAAELLEQAVEKKSDDRALLMALCDEYNASGRGQDAVSVLEKIVESYGNRRSKELAEIHRRLATAFQSQGDLPRAAEELEKAFRIEPGNIYVLKALGQLSIETSDWKRAQQMFRALLLQKLTPESPITKAEVFYYLGVVHHRLDEKPKAIQMLERALQADAQLTEAESLLQQLRG